jgi:crotonobetainyl-CoA:carnitine CoA-transferase CaiB-like acyl-CoA transferase
MDDRPLEKLRVLDVSHTIAGPFCTMLLANAGAEIIKVEPPDKGERTRWSGRPIQAQGSEPVTLQYVRVNRGKKGITLNLRHEQGKVLFRQLAAISDVLTENFRPGVMKKLGLDYEALKAVNPRLIYATISGFGRREDLRGPYSDWPANNPSAQAMCGLMDVTGESGGAPSLVGASIGDTIPGLWAAYSILLALEHRRKTGEGQHVDIAMYDCLVMHNDVALPFYDLTGVSPGRDREDMWSAQLRLETKDGFVMLSGAVRPDKWAQLWRAAGREDLAKDPEYLGQEIQGPFFLRVIRPALEEWTRQKSRMELCHSLLDLGFSAAMVQTAAEVYSCPQLKARRMFHEFEFTGKKFRHPGDPAKLSEVPEAPPAPPPLLGEHNAYVFQELLGLNAQEVQELHAQGVI